MCVQHTKSSECCLHNPTNSNSQTSRLSRHYCLYPLCDIIWVNINSIHNMIWTRHIVHAYCTGIRLPSKGLKRKRETHVRVGVIRLERAHFERHEKGVWCISITNARAEACGHGRLMYPSDIRTCTTCTYKHYTHTITPLQHMHALYLMLYQEQHADIHTHSINLLHSDMYGYLLVDM